MQTRDRVAELADHVERTREPFGGRFERLDRGGSRVMWKHSSIPRMILCVEQDRIVDGVEQNGGVHDILLVGEERDPEDLYPFDDVCSCWAGGWQGSLPTEDPLKPDLGPKHLPDLIDACVDASIEYATQQGELAAAGDPPEPVLTLTESLALVDNYAGQIAELFSGGQIDDTRTKLRQRKQRLYERIGIDFGDASEVQQVPFGMAAQSVPVK